jgi:hypothetical protein
MQDVSRRMRQAIGKLDYIALGCPLPFETDHWPFVLRRAPLSLPLNFPSAKKCQQKCQQTSLVESKMELRKVGWSLLDLNHKRLYYQGNGDDLDS